MTQKEVAALEEAIANIKANEVDCQKRMAKSYDEFWGAIDSIRKELKETNDKMVTEIQKLTDKMMNRLPNWASMLFAVLLAIIGWLARGALK